MFTSRPGRDALGQHTTMIKFDDIRIARRVSSEVALQSCHREFRAHGGVDDERRDRGDHIFQIDCSTEVTER